MRKVENWDIRLGEFLAENRERRFAYGTWDCFQFVRGALAAMTGEDVGAKFRPYASMFGYRRQMLRYCKSTSLIRFARTLMTDIGAEAVPSGFASRGDVVLCAGVDPAFGLVALDGYSALVLDEGGEIRRIPLSPAVEAWRI